MIREGMSVEFTEDTAPQGEPTPNTHTDCVEVPRDEIEIFGEDGKAAVSKSPSGKSGEPDWQRMYAMKANGVPWKQVSKEYRIVSPWLKVKKYADANGLPWPPSLPSKEELEEVEEELEEEPEPKTVAEEPKAPESPPAEPEGPSEPRYKVYDLQVHRSMEKVSPDHTHTLEFQLGGSVVRFSLTHEPTHEQCVGIMEIESQNLLRRR